MIKRYAVVIQTYVVTDEIKNQINLADEVIIPLNEDDWAVKQILNDPPNPLELMDILQSAAGKLLKKHLDETNKTEGD